MQPNAPSPPTCTAHLAAQRAQRRLLHAYVRAVAVAVPQHNKLHDALQEGGRGWVLWGALLAERAQQVQQHNAHFKPCRGAEGHCV